MKFTSTIPIYIDHKGVLAAICSLITDRSEDNWFVAFSMPFIAPKFIPSFSHRGITIFDVPGAGKTTAIVEAAKKTNSGYIRYRVLIRIIDLIFQQIPHIVSNMRRI